VREWDVFTAGIPAGQMFCGSVIPDIHYTAGNQPQNDKISPNRSPVPLLYQDLGRSTEWNLNELHHIIEHIYVSPDKVEEAKAAQPPAAL
jgi:hypothetical protein